MSWLRDEVRVEVRRTVALALPVVLTQLSLMSMSFVDVLMIGRLGALELGAAQLARSAFYPIALIALGCVAGIEPIVGQNFGAGRRERTGAALWQAFWISLGLGVPLTLLFLDFRWAFLLAGQDPAVTEAAHSYLAARAPGTVAFLLFAAQRCFLNSVGDPRSVLWVALGANIVNAFGNWVLIFGNLGFPALGLQGAGIATAIGLTWMALHMAWMVFGRARYRGFGLGWVAPRVGEIIRILRIGLPLGIQIGAEVGVFAAAAFLIGHLGEVELAAHAVAITLASTTFMVPLGVGVAASARVAQLIGAGQPEAAARAGHVALGLGAVCMTASTLVFCAFPVPLIGIFNDDPAVLVAGIWLVRLAGLFQISDGLQAVAAGCLRGAADTKVSMWTNLLSHWGLGLPLAYVFAFRFGWGAPGVWLGLTASLVVVAVVLVHRFLRGPWRMVGALEPDPAPSPAAAPA